MIAAGMAPHIVVDTCVWVDSYCASHAGNTEARAFLRLAVKREAQLLYAVHAAKDVLYVLAHEFKRMARRPDGTIDDSVARAAQVTALACLRNMEALATAVGADASDLWLADRYLGVHGDFEDDLVLAACHRAKADFLVTSDAALLRHADVAAKTPAEMAELLEAPRA